MKQYSFITIGILLLTCTEVTYAQQQSIPLDVDDYEACLEILRLPESIADKGTYKLRMDQCIDQRIHAREFGYNEASDRLFQRTLRVRQDLDSGLLRAPVQAQDIRRYITPQQRTISTDTVDSVQDRMRARLQKTFHKNVAESQIRNVYYERPSRRLIKDRAYSQTREEKQIESDLFQERWTQAVETCRHIDNNFTRTNCIRAELRKLGAQ